MREDRKARALITVCAWCETPEEDSLGHGAQGVDPPRRARLSHGMCQECRSSINAELNSLFASGATSPA